MTDWDCHGERGKHTRMHCSLYVCLLACCPQMTNCPRTFVVNQIYFSLLTRWPAFVTVFFFSVADVRKKSSRLDNTSSIIKSWNHATKVVLNFLAAKSRNCFPFFKCFNNFIAYVFWVFCFCLRLGISGASFDIIQTHYCYCCLNFLKLPWFLQMTEHISVTNTCAYVYTSMYIWRF